MNQLQYMASPRELHVKLIFNYVKIKGFSLPYQPHYLTDRHCMNAELALHLPTEKKIYHLFISGRYKTQYTKILIEVDLHSSRKKYC